MSAVAEDNVVTVSAVIGEGKEARRVVRVGSWDLIQRVGEEEPKIRDLELAERLEYDRPRNIRVLIGRLIKEGKLSGVEVRFTVKQTLGGRPGKEYWLTEAQAIKVIAKSETAMADATLDQIIAVFIAARKGLLPQQQTAANDAVAALRAEFAEWRSSFPLIVGEVIKATLDARTAQDGASIGPVGSREIRRELLVYGQLMATPGDRREAKVWRSSGEIELRSHLGYSGSGRQWAALPAGDLARARVFLVGMVKRAQRNAAQRAAGAQIPMPDIG